MNKSPISAFLLALITLPMSAQTKIDISGNNTSSSYVSYNTGISLATGKTVDVYMARYCYFSSQITGGGTLNLHAGGERSYLGTAKGAAWPNWTSFKGDIHIFPYKENAPSAGFYGVVLAHGGKTFSPENVEDAIKSGKVNSSMANNHVTLHAGATICCEANTSGAGFRIGELNTEEGSYIQGYMKKGTHSNIIRLKDIFRIFPAYQLVSLADEHGSQLPYGHMDKIIDLEGIYEDAEVLNMRIVSDVLYIRIKM